MRKIGLCSVTFRKLSSDEVIALAVKNGLDCIEWGGDIHVPPGDLKEAERVGRATRAHDLACDSYGSYFRCDGFEGFPRVSQTARALGASVIRVWAGEKDAEDFSQEEFEALVQTVGACADYAKKFGQKIAFEYHYGTYCNRPETVKKLLGAVCRQNAGTYWQPAYWAGGLSEGERVRGNLAALDLLSGLPVNVHVYAWRGFERFPLSFDEREWALYCEKIPKGSSLLIEFTKDDDIKNFEADIKTLKRITGRI